VSQSKGQKRLRAFATELHSTDVFGAWVPIVALTASKTQALREDDRVRVLARLEVALGNLQLEPQPSKWAWRDLTDMVNFLQSLIELGWATDESGHIEAAKQALYRSSRALEDHGTIRLDGPGLSAMREVLDQFTELLGQLSAHSYWVAVRHTKQRIQRLLLGGKRQGDVVVAI
jgi:hypothetical protein